MFWNFEKSFERALRWLTACSVVIAGIGVAWCSPVRPNFLFFFSLDSFFLSELKIVKVMTWRKNNSPVELDPLPHWIAVSVMRLEMGIYYEYGSMAPKKMTKIIKSTQKK